MWFFLKRCICLLPWHVMHFNRIITKSLLCCTINLNDVHLFIKKNVGVTYEILNLTDLKMNYWIGASVMLFYDQMVLRLETKQKKINDNFDYYFQLFKKNPCIFYILCKRYVLHTLHYPSECIVLRHL